MSKDMRDPMRANVGFAANMFQSQAGHSVLLCLRHTTSQFKDRLQKQLHQNCYLVDGFNHLEKYESQLGRIIHDYPIYEMETNPAMFEPPTTYIHL